MFIAVTREELILLNRREHFRQEGGSYGTIIEAGCGIADQR